MWVSIVTSASSLDFLAITIFVIPLWVSKGELSISLSLKKESFVNQVYRTQRNIIWILLSQDGDKKQHQLPLEHQGCTRTRSYWSCVQRKKQGIYWLYLCYRSINLLVLSSKTLVFNVCRKLAKKLLSRQPTILEWWDPLKSETENSKFWAS